ncbi:BamA/TamA family outer membrane protein [Cryomorphaceae bacterium 1068]|nr:BamA/TamA family outer membrane protein [Cryomorphaceae bacterium 1068]
MNYTIKICAAVLALVASATGVRGQKVLALNYDTIVEAFEPPLYLNDVTDSLTALIQLKSVTDKFQAAGFLTAGIDSIAPFRSDTVEVQIYTGPKFKWALLNSGNIPEETLSIIGFREELYFQESLNTKQIQRLFKKLLDQAENSGYPFAQVYLDSVQIDKDQIKATLNYQKGDFVEIDSLIIKGELSTNRRYIENFIGFKKGRPYNQSDLRNIPTRLKEIQFIQTIKPYEVGMRPGVADIYLYLKPRKASNFDGILGVLPDPVTGDILFTGDVKLNLMNALKRGETIKLQWQRLQTQTSQLDIQFKYPFLFNTPLGIDFKFNLYRRDTTFSQNRLNVGLEYYFPGDKRVKVFYENQGANVIGNSDFVSPDLADSQTNLFGIGAYVSDLDYRFNPRNGYYLETTAATGQKEITSQVEGEANQKSDIYNFNLDAGYFLPLFKRSALHFRMQGGMFLNENMFRNEIYRIGGLKTLRGFDEQAIFASSFAIGTIEYRFILEQNSNLFVFFDQAYYEDESTEEKLSDTPFGFGAGVNFETNAGVFSLTYALGRQFDNDVSFRGGKIHFGFISFF